MRHLLSFSGLMAALALLGCNTPSPQDPPTFHEDIAPLFQKHCNNCHIKGGIAPFPLDNYQDAFENGDLIREYVLTGEMPPFHINNSGDCQTYQEARVLSEEEKALVVNWVDSGMLEGDPNTELPPPTPPPALDRVDAIADMGVDYLPDANLTDDYRCFIIDPQLETDKFLTAYEVIPGEPTVVHHMVLFAVDTPEDEAAAQALDDADPRPGYTCFGDSGVSGARLITAWAPGVAVQKFPANTGLPLTAGRKLIMQVHYNTLAGILPDRTQLALQLEDNVPLEAVNVLVGDFDFVLPPGQEEVITTEEFSLDALPISVRAHAVFPHMHILGRTMRIELDRADGSTECVADVPDWDFHWQQFFLYSNAVRVNPTDTLRISCSYDTRGVTEPVTFGEGTTDEMCLAFFYITL